MLSPLDFLTVVLSPVPVGLVILLVRSLRARRSSADASAPADPAEGVGTHGEIPMDPDAFPAPRRLPPAPVAEVIPQEFVPMLGHHDPLLGSSGAARLLVTVPPDRDGVWICMHGQTVRLLLVVKGKILDLGGDSLAENAETEVTLRQDAWWAGPFDVLALARVLNGRQAIEMFMRFQDA